MLHKVSNRFAFFWRMFLTYLVLQKGERILSIGQRTNERKIYEWMWYFVAKLKGYSILEILEIWDKNVNELRKEGKALVVKGDVREIDNLYPENSLDTILWFEGPEHIEINEIRPTIEKLKTIANRIILSCPCGKYPQGASFGNPFERHKTMIFPKDLKKSGLKVVSLNTSIHTYLFGYM